MTARNVLLYLALRVGAEVLPRLPPALAYRLAAFVGTCAFYLFPGPRRNIARNLGIVLGSDPSSHLVREAARGAFRNDAKNWVDTLRIGSLSADQIGQLVEVDGWERLDGALAPGRGAVIAVTHLGNIDLVGQALAARGYRVTVPVEHMRPQALFDFLVARRRSNGMNVVPVERAPREMLRALKRGEIVAIAADRMLGGRGVEVEMFGRTTTIPRGPAALAQRTGAPLLLGVGLRLGTNRFQGYVTPIDSSETRRGEEELTRALAEAMARYIRQYPDQWLMFSPFWPEGGDREQPATMEHRTGAAV